MSVKDNILYIQNEIASHLGASNRKTDEVKLIAVSKLMADEKLLEALSAGQVAFGENWVQELCGKMERLPGIREWHFIGHLQTNKVKYIVGKVALIQSVDSLHLAEAIASFAEKRGLMQDVLLEVNAGEEESKYGLTIEETPYIIDKIKELTGIRVRGLMTVAPVCKDPEEVRPVFRAMYQLYNYLKEAGHPLDILSMGMSGDYRVAIEEGSNMIRVGSSIFGKRNYNK